MFALILLAEIPALFLLYASGFNRQNLLTLGLLSVLALAASWYGGTLFVEKWIRPLLTVTRNLEKGDRSARSGLPHTKHELGELARSIDEMAESLEQLPRQAELILDSAGNGVISLDPQERVTYVNPAAAKTLGFVAHELMGKSLHALVHHSRLNGEAYPEKECPIYLAAKNGTTQILADEIFWKKDGSHFPVEYAITPIRQQGKAAGAVMVFNDLSEKVRMKELDHMSYHDALTGLPNRRLFEDRLHQMVLASQRQRQPFALLVFDLNGFKEINDTYGHPCGNLVLRQLSLRLAKTVRESDTIARLGGDEFALILPNANLDGAKEVIRDLLRCFDQPINVGGHVIKISASIGVTVSHQDTNPELMERQADEAMYRAKRAKQPFSVYHSRRPPTPETPDRRHPTITPGTGIRAKRTHTS